MQEHFSAMYATGRRDSACSIAADIVEHSLRMCALVGTHLHGCDHHSFVGLCIWSRSSCHLIADSKPENSRFSSNNPVDL